MNSIQASPGDVALFGAPIADPVTKTRPPLDPISTIIQYVTKSPYSHSAVCHAPGRFAESGFRPLVVDRPDAGADVREIGDDEWRSRGSKRVIHLFRPAGTVGEAGLAGYVAQQLARAKAPADRSVFSVGALAGLGLLRNVDRMRDVDILDRMHRALVVALDDDDRDLFCSEFVYRASEAGGYAPPLPADPFIPDEALEPIGELGIGVVTSAFEWVAKLFDSIAKLDEDAWDSIRRTTAATVAAFEADAPMPDAPHRSNFYVPKDYLPGEGATAHYAHVGTWDPVAGGWGRPGPV